jgi:hypothetical protein
MAEQKAVPDRPKDDPANFATSVTPAATPPSADLPLGPATLEAQREGFKKAEQAVAGQVADNPLAVSGVDADIENALRNPEASGPVGTSKEDVENVAGATKEGVKEQAEEVKKQQQEAAQSAPPPGPQTTTDAPKSSSGGVQHLSSASTQQPVQGPLPAKQEGDPAQLAKDEGARVQAGDPAQQHADEAVGSAPEAVSDGGPAANTPPGDTSKASPPPPTPEPVTKRKRGRPRKHPQNP